jgi:nucleoside 2-deoxyribosyltransferase
MKKKQVIYIIGSLRNKNVPVIANILREKTDHEIFDSWYSPGPHADDFWREYEKGKGVTYKQALNDWAAKHIFEFDTFHLNRADAAVLIMPAGKSAHLELGYAIGKGKRGYILFDQEPTRWDVMVQFCTNVFFNVDELITELNSVK